MLFNWEVFDGILTPPQIHPRWIINFSLFLLSSFFTQNKSFLFPFLEDRPNDGGALFPILEDRPNNGGALFPFLEDRPNNGGALFPIMEDRPNNGGALFPIMEDRPNNGGALFPILETENSQKSKVLLKIEGK